MSHPFLVFGIAFLLLLGSCSADDRVLEPTDLDGEQEQNLSVDISNPRALMFAADQEQNLIDVISINSGKVVYRIETGIHADHIVATPFAPILVYADIEAKKITFYDLAKKQESLTIELPLSPRHLVLDTTGSLIGVSDDQDGGFALVDPFEERIRFALDNFPASPDVLFDPNEVDIYFSNSGSGSIGILNMNTQESYEIPVTEEADQLLTAPSRSLDGHYIYVGNASSGEVYSMNAYSGAIFKTFDLGGVVARPYTTPEGAFLYMMDSDAGRLLSINQQGFNTYVDTSFDKGIDLVAVGRFDRLSLFLSSENDHWYIYDNVTKSVVEEGLFPGTPIDVFGSADGKLAYVALSDVPMVATVNLERKSLEYLAATETGSGAFTIGLSNNVCH